ncbi:MAG: Guanine deaminase [Cyanobacteriota bacterium]
MDFFQLLLELVASGGTVEDGDGFEQAKSAEYTVKVGLGTDMGASTSFSMLQTTNEVYKVTQLRNQKLSAFKALFLATLGGTQALCLDDKIGSFNPGNKADFVVLNPKATPCWPYATKPLLPKIRLPVLIPFSPYSSSAMIGLLRPPPSSAGCLIRHSAG